MVVHGKKLSRKLIEGALNNKSSVLEGGFMQEGWEEISGTSRRLKVPGGWLYNTWSWQMKFTDLGFFTGTYQERVPINEQTVFVPDPAQIKES